ncbi:MAG TPA: serine protease [Longimicrobium sp.]|nr:serine protease [Longimicrobium sp.]
MSDTIRGHDVVLQHLPDFTVQVRHAGTGTIVGTGIVVSHDGLIATCAHVLEAAGLRPGDGTGGEVVIHFPQSGVPESARARRATCAAYFPDHDDDIALLRLVDGPVPLARQQVAVLGTADGSEGNPFRTYGYAPLGDRLSRYVDGEIMGPIELAPSAGRRLQSELVELRTRDVRPGISGGAVLDERRNLVVGLATERWDPGKKSEDDNVAWATNARVLSFAPLGLTVQHEPLVRGEASTPPSALLPTPPPSPADGPRLALAAAPAPVAHWVGRDALLDALDADRTGGTRRIAGLIGFGGEGKSSLARHWVDRLLASPPEARPDTVLWWTFRERSGVDEFFEHAIAFLGGAPDGARRFPSASARAHLLAALLATGRHLLVLDGLEAVQHGAGDRYALLRNADLRSFLEYCAAPTHASFCLVTSRAPLLDAVAYTTYVQHVVGGLSRDEGRALLRALGASGTNAALDAVVADWSGHAFALSLLAALARDRYDGDVRRAAERLDSSPGRESRTEQVHHVLERYDEGVLPVERTLLILLSVLRTPITAGLLLRAARCAAGWDRLDAPLESLDEPALVTLAERLVERRLVQASGPAASREYSVHPLVRRFYLERLAARDQAARQALHTCLADFHYQWGAARMPYVPRRFRGSPPLPTLDALGPWIEVVHHACLAGLYDRAFTFMRSELDGAQGSILLTALGAADVALSLARGFFPDGNPSREALVSREDDRDFLLNRIGACLAAQGRLGEGVGYYARSAARTSARGDWHNASINHRNLTALHADRGALAEATLTAAAAVDLARRSGVASDVYTSRAWQGWIAHLAGHLADAKAAFDDAEALCREATGAPHMVALRGVQHARHLLRTAQRNAAREVTLHNLAWCQSEGYLENISRCHALLGALAALDGDPASARRHHDAAVRAARASSVRSAVIEALVARGGWAARHGGSALDDLEEALHEAATLGFNLLEADARVAIAWASLATGDQNRLRREAEHAEDASATWGYYWGQVDAQEVLAAGG